MGAKLCNCLAVVGLAIGTCAGVRGATIIVDNTYLGAADYLHIQDAIDNSVDGDVIEVQPGKGTYAGGINFHGRRITVVANGAVTIGHTVADVATVRFDSGESEGSILVGFEVKHVHSDGKAIECYYSSPQIRDVTISDAAVGIYGEFASPDILNCHIHYTVEPSVPRSTGIYGCDGNISGCVIEDCGAGIESCDGLISDCWVERCLRGIEACNGTILNCIVRSGNDGLYECNGVIKNCTVVENTSGLYNCAAEISNCIIAMNDKYGLWGCGSNLRYNDVWQNEWANYAGGTIPSPTDIHSNPLLWVQDVLQSTVGTWSFQTEDWVVMNADSPCIDAGDPCDSIGFEPNPNGGRINMGAYGGTTYASLSPNGTGPEPTPRCETPIPGDADGDCRVDLRDIATVAMHWLECNLVPASACD